MPLFWLAAYMFSMLTASGVPILAKMWLNHFAITASSEHVYVNRANP